MLEQNLIVWTDYRNSTYKNTERASDRMLRQRFLLEEYRVELRFIQGIKNENADMLSRNELVHEPENTVSILAFEHTTLDIRLN